jgi:hypothetical protein
MKLNQALDIAFECMTAEMKKLSPSHQAWELGNKNDKTAAAHVRYLDLVFAMQRLEELKHQGRLFG